MKTGAKHGMFIFDSYSIKPALKEVRLNYKILKGGREMFFEETLSFPKNLPWAKLPKETLDSALRSLHLICGLSYWKAHCLPIEIPYYAMPKKEAVFWEKVYTRGLGEFFYKNKIDFRGLVKFPFAAKAKESKSSPKNKLPAKHRSLLLFGGGKDSLVSAELLKSMKKDFTFFALATNNQIANQKKIMPKGSIIVERRIDPQLFELNKEKGVFNGHIPISAIIAFISEFSALIYGYKYVISSNEKSADYGNIKYLGQIVNHQWSKSIEFERMFQEYSHGYITPHVAYFSLLRPIYEIKIIEIFSRYSKYFHKFTSCNANFKIYKDKLKVNWCNICPKCVFIFTMLSAFLPKAELIKIFSDNLYKRVDLEPVFKELLGLKKFKPFECVGTPEEMILAIFMAYKSGEYRNDPIMNLFAKTILKKDYNILKIQKDLMKIYKPHFIPKEFSGALKLMKKNHEIRRFGKI